jgi:glucose-6-phosphate isomerase
LESNCQDYRIMNRSSNAGPDSIRIDKFYINFARFIDITEHFNQDDIDKYYHLLDDRFSSLHAGDRVNVTEDRFVAHFLTRGTKGSKGTDLVREGIIRKQMYEFFSFIDRVADGTICNQNGDRFQHVINIGIGGSHLGPEMLCIALSSQYTKLMDHHFISNLDPLSFQSAIAGVDPVRTLIIVGSKTFTTTETLMNLKLIGDWLSDNGVSFQNNVVGVTANTEAAITQGLADKMVLAFDENIGGRFSISSPVSLIVGLCYGSKVFKDFLAGLNAIDSAVSSSAKAKHALYNHAIGYVKAKETLNLDTIAILPYSEALVRFPAFLQQLFMESLGKSTALTSDKFVEAGLVLFGEPGTSSQHSFMQFLHQSSKPIAAEFIVIKPDRDNFYDARRLLSLNAVAQAEALECGQPIEDIDSNVKFRAHRVIAGNKPSVFIILEQLDAYAIGELVSWYEHLVIALGFLWDINTFDQFGVELGKDLAKKYSSEDNEISNPVTKTIIR